LKPENYPCQSPLKQNILLFPLNRTSFCSSENPVKIYASTSGNIEVQPTDCQQSVKQEKGAWSFNPSAVPFQKDTSVVTIQMQYILDEIKSNIFSIEVIKSPSCDFTFASTGKGRKTTLFSLAPKEVNKEMNYLWTLDPNSVKKGVKFKIPATGNQSTEANPVVIVPDNLLSEIPVNITLTTTAGICTSTSQPVNILA
jgi:hypothetical protein